MSSDATKVPGLHGNAPDYQDFYSRNQAAPGQGMPRQANATVVPGMNSMAPRVEEQQQQNPMAANNQTVPVVGFLYSISRQGFGEYWPLHIGSNKIGRSADNDVVLGELTVTDRHASLNIKQLKSTGKLLASIRDDGSKNGLYVNDEELDYDQHPVKNHDIITIGNNYKLLLILIDAKDMGLSIAEDFQPVAVEAPQPAFDQNFPGLPNPDDTGSLYSSSNRVENGTVAMDGSSPVTSGRTRFL
ncbi:MAG: FHA domain-containing protein [Muribaculaceae bacterium]|nr:FHA domain-containing protein [Muribaculaceae bacterium]